ncbi:hypothetical protein K505DRAFT_352118 [Melanomma pulvis-pyrius CBS 109.77]|uniref:Protein kinase domain-containing protein n=1 Tax=Melanomma pulvis-pyrius CBS 109.77 TaxID=1314802 RepID=A0A6A6X1T2_9PLEO|nr:hypothetical protein K505DRAFT_352118 [Melanomma pulvis-pyrius CBS 109.77]
MVVQLNNNVSLVRISDLKTTTLFVFKTNLRNLSYLYHELRLLLLMSQYEHIIGKPTYIVTTELEEGKSSRVVGFILEYYEHGSLSTTLDSGKPFTVRWKLGWALQILDALIHVIRGPDSFYSDLKPDNIVFTSPFDKLVLIHFEQAALLESERESAMAYSLGKILWCIFEGGSYTHNSMDEKYEVPANVVFPQYKSTPRPVKELIRMLRESLGYVSISQPDPTAQAKMSPREVVEASQNVWESRIFRMEKYVKVMSRLREGNYDKSDELLLGVPLRPKFIYVFQKLQDLARHEE